MDWLVGSDRWLTGLRAMTAAQAGAVDTFTSAGVIGLGAYTGELGPWTMEVGVPHGAAVEGGRLGSNSSTTSIFSLRGPAVGANQFVKATLRRGSGTAASAGMALAVRCNGNNAYWARWEASNNVFQLCRTVAGVSTLMTAVANTFGLAAAGDEVEFSLSVVDTALAVMVNGAVILAGSNAELTSGYPGVRSTTSQSLGVGPELDNLTVGIASGSQAGK